jgi:hypothetical protein
VSNAASPLAGEMWDTSNWRRGQMSATIYQTFSPTATMSALPVQAFTGELLAGMEHRGWIVYYTGCNHPAALPLGSVCAARAGEPPVPVAKGRPITVEVQSDDPYPPSAGSVRR